VPNRSWRERLFSFHWAPQPLSTPKIDPDLAYLNALQRAAEAFRYTALRAEYWLSPHGTLRECCRLNLKLATLLAAPALLVSPVITSLLYQFSTWTELLVRIASNLVVFPLAAILALALLTGTLIALRAIFGR
jgi:hypothetical protein